MAQYAQPSPGERIVLVQRRLVEVSFRCQTCGLEHTIWHAPGPKPKYCEACRQVSKAAKTAERVRRHRAAKRAAGDVTALPRRGTSQTLHAAAVADAS